MREMLITDQPVHALFPYGRMLDAHTLLLHDAPGLSRGGIPKGFALGAMWEMDPLNIDAMTWGEMDEILGLLAAPIRDLPMGAVLETRMTIRPVFDDPAWIQARSGRRHERIASQIAHIRDGMPHHMGGDSLSVDGVSLSPGAPGSHPGTEAGSPPGALRCPRS